MEVREGQMVQERLALLLPEGAEAEEVVRVGVAQVPILEAPEVGWEIQAPVTMVPTAVEVQAEPIAL